MNQKIQDHKSQQTTWKSWLFFSRIWYVSCTSDLSIAMFLLVKRNWRIGGCWIFLLFSFWYLLHDCSMSTSLKNILCGFLSVCSIFIEFWIQLPIFAHKKKTTLVWKRSRSLKAHRAVNKGAKEMKLWSTEQLHRWVFHADIYQHFWGPLSAFSSPGWAGPAPSAFLCWGDALVPSSSS